MKQYDLFISYASADKEWVLGNLLPPLDRAGINYWNESEADLGRSILDSLDDALQRSHRVLLVISEGFLYNRGKQWESNLAHHFAHEAGNLPIIPLYRTPPEKLPHLPIRDRMMQAIYATDEKSCQESIQRLCNEFKRPLLPRLTLPPCPYLGLRSFTAQDSKHFFGRRFKVEELLVEVKRAPITFVIGPSGSGKSSLVAAGLVPELKKDLDGLPWLCYELRPGTDPIASLVDAFDIMSESTDLSAALHKKVVAQTRSARLLIFVDQLEELFTQAKTQALEFQNLLCSLAELSGVSLVLTVRADFYADLMQSVLYRHEQSAQVTLLPLSGADLREAITEPAKSQKVYLDHRLVERLIADGAEEPGVMPLVQETLLLLWPKLQESYLAVESYEALATQEHKTGLQTVIARRAEDTFRKVCAQFPDSGEKITQRIFIRLVQFGEGRKDTRRQQFANDLIAGGDQPSDFNGILHRLINDRLLTSSGDQGDADRRIDISHEIILESWPRLDIWLAARKESEIIRRRLSEKAKEWVSLGRSKEALLNKEDIKRAQDWLTAEMKLGLGTEPELLNFIQKSQQSKKRKRIIDSFLATTAIFLGLSAFVIWRNGEQRAMNITLDLWSGAVNAASLEDSDIAEIETMLSHALERADADQDSLDETRRDKALAYYRQIQEDAFSIINHEDASELPQATKDRFSRIRDLAEDRIADMILKSDTFKAFQEHLKSGNYGRRATASPPRGGDAAFLSDQDDGSGNSALKITYQLLMMEKDGAYADRNENGRIDNEREASKIPCRLLQEIHNHWLASTKDQCGWGKSCSEYDMFVDGFLLEDIIFFDSEASDIEEILKRCELI